MHFTWDRTQEEVKDFPELRQFAVIAQDVQEYVPELVENKDNGYLGVNYPVLAAFAVEGNRVQQEVIDKQQGVIEEQNAKIAQLQKDIEELREMLQALSAKP
ncbi:MAG: hypothetical protein IT292_08725 [Deltaproteobacteria bacterium]|nr:hypothetical protein [Deltaproteobacteria bacterium]